jgi:NACHT conflict system protein
LDRTRDAWHLARELGSLIATHPHLRSHVYNLLKDGPTTPGLAILARAVAEAPDEDGLLLLIRFERELKGAFVTWQTIERLVTEHVPASDWAGAYNVVPVPAGSLRQKLLALTTTDGGPADAAARWLRQIDWIRDERGMPEAEPRHPDLASGKPWPIMQPDPDAVAEG